MIVLIWLFLTVIKIWAESFIKILKLLMSIILLQYFCYIRNFQIFIFHVCVVSLYSCLWLWFLLMIKIEFLFIIFLFLWFVLWFVCQKAIVDSLLLLIQSEQTVKNDFNEIFLSKQMCFSLSSCMIFMFFVHILFIWSEVWIMQILCFISCCQLN